MKLPLTFFAKDLGLDLGTANSLVYVRNRGIVINEPSIVSLNNRTGQILAVGGEAKKMLSRTPAHITATRPLINGVISDFDITQEMIRHFLKKAGVTSPFSYSRVVIGVPSNLTEVERKSVEDAAVGAGAVKTFLIEQPLAAAVGARLPIEEPTANLIIDIGGGTTDIAIISMGGIVTAKSLKIAGDKFNEDIIRYIRDEFKLIIGEPTAEELKITIGSAVPLEEKLEIAARGRDASTGLPREITVKNTQIRAALERSLQAIVAALREVIEVSPPELVGDILKRGIYLCGGGSLLRGIDQLIEKETGINTEIIEDPLTCVVRGTGIIIEDIEKYEQVLANVLAPRKINL